MPSDAARRLKAITRERIPHVDEYYDGLEYETDALGAFRLRPNQRLPHVTVNSDGFRGRELTGEEAVLLLGDSATFGVGLSGDDACFSRRLETLTGLRVADASVRGYRVWQHYAQLPQLLQRLPKARHVLLWCGYVDLDFWTLAGGCIEGAYTFDRKYMPGRLKQGWLPRVFWRLRRTPWGTAMSAAMTGQQPATALWRKGSINDLAAHVALHGRAMRDICVARHIQFHLLMQPFMRTQPARSDLRLLVDAFNDKVRADCGRSWYECAPQFIDALRAALQRDGLPWFDAQPHVGEDDFIDQGHMRETGYERLAAAIAPLMSTH